MNKDYVLRFDHVGYHYQDGNCQINILKDVCYNFEKGKTYAIVGASGSGKTTSLIIAGGLDKPQSGHVIYKGKDIEDIGLTQYRRDHVSIVFQSYNLMTYMNAIQNVVCAMDISKIKVASKKKYALDILKQLGLDEAQCQRDIRKLSGGQQQRVAIARAIAKDVDLILCDEPTGNLDQETSQGIIDTFIHLAHAKKKCVIVVTHSHELASRLDVQLTIQQGQFKEL